jgi:hypothetical protein
MNLKDSLFGEIEETRRRYLQLLESIPESDYPLPTNNPAWTIGDVLYHIRLGPPAIRFEVWMVRYAPWIFGALNDSTSRIFHWGNALFARHPKRITPQSLIKAYEAGHAGLISDLRRVKEAEFKKSVVYPEAYVSELAGVVTVERLFRYVKGHFEIHEGQIRASAVWR